MRTPLCTESIASLLLRRIRYSIPYRGVPLESGETGETLLGVVLPTEAKQFDYVHTDYSLQ